MVTFVIVTHSERHLWRLRRRFGVHQRGNESPIEDIASAISVRFISTYIAYCLNNVYCTDRVTGFRSLTGIHINVDEVATLLWIACTKVKKGRSNFLYYINVKVYLLYLQEYGHDATQPYGPRRN